MTYMDHRPEGLNTEKAQESIVERLKPAIVQAFESSGLSSSHAHRTAFAAGWNAAQQKWLSVDAVLPDAQKDVLVRKEFGSAVYYDIAGLFYGKWESQITQDECKFRVTHWMPLPAAPNEEVKNG